MLLNIIDALTGLMKTNCSEWRLQWLEMTIIRDLSRGSVSLLEISGWLYYNKLHACGQWWRVKLSEWVKIHLKNVSITGVSKLSPGLSTQQPVPRYSVFSWCWVFTQLTCTYQHSYHKLHKLKLKIICDNRTQVDWEHFSKKYLWKLLLLRILVQFMSIFMWRVGRAFPQLGNL